MSGSGVLASCIICERCMLPPDHRSIFRSLAMKYLLIPLALVAGSALACPGEGSKEAAAPASAKPAIAQTAMPKAKVAAVKTEIKATATPAKTATRSSAEPRKVAGL
jgi:hypothetical protein